MNRNLIFLLALAVTVRIAFFLHTGHTAEDAYITFAFARNLTEGDGFTYNLGHPIYGTTTPLFALLMVPWMLISYEPALGATMLGLLAVIGGLFFMYRSLARWEHWTALIPLAVSLPLIAEDMSGMETPFLFLFLAGAWWSYMKGNPLWTGVFCGLLLWTRIDSVVFVAIMFFLYFNRPNVLWFLAGLAIYLPWLVFAQFYFGSVLPFTVTAKIVAYGTGVENLPMHFGRMVSYFTVPYLLAFIACLPYISKKYMPLVWFFVLETTFLCYSGATFFDRYLYLPMVSSALLIGTAISNLPKPSWRTAGVVVFILLTFSRSDLEYFKSLQQNRNEHLREIGMWLNKNTSTDTTLQLEPLGYMGFYADRFVYDEVGLVTPAVVELHRQKIGAENFYKYLKTDYVILQCGQAGNVMEDFDAEYDLIKTFSEGTARACYEVWERTDG